MEKLNCENQNFKIRKENPDRKRRRERWVRLTLMGEGTWRRDGRAGPTVRTTISTVFFSLFGSSPPLILLSFKGFNSTFSSSSTISPIPHASTSHNFFAGVRTDGGVGILVLAFCFLYNSSLPSLSLSLSFSLDLFPSCHDRRFTLIYFFSIYLFYWKLNEIIQKKNLFILVK